MVAASCSPSLIFSALPLRLKAFDQAKSNICALCVAISAVRNLTCSGGEEILALYLKQAKDKRSMASIQAINWREKFTNILGDYEREMYVWTEKTESEGASGASSSSVC